VAQKDAWRAYVELALGLTETSRKKAMKIVQEVAGKGGATAEQLQELVSQGLANREAMTRMIRVEMDRALGRVGLATMDEVEELNRRVRDLERELYATRVAAGMPTEPGVDGVAPAATVATIAKKTVAKKAVAKKAVASGGPAKASTASTGPAKKAAAKKTAAKKAPAKKAAAKKTVEARKAPAKASASVSTSAAGGSSAAANKAAPKKAATKKAAAKNTAAKKTTAKKTTAKKTAGSGS
jgi:polyhydroxyalkanoate synthesis regulator phasin